MSEAQILPLARSDVAHQPTNKPHMTIIEAVKTLGLTEALTRNDKTIDFNAHAALAARNMPLFKKRPRNFLAQYGISLADANELNKLVYG